MDNFPEIPQPTEHGWKLLDDSIEPRWTEKEILPIDIIDLVTECDEEESDDEIICLSSDSDESESEFVFET